MVKTRICLLTFVIQTSIFCFDKEVMFIDEKSKGIYTLSDVDNNVMYEGKIYCKC